MTMITIAAFCSGRDSGIFDLKTSLLRLVTLAHLFSFNLQRYDLLLSLSIFAIQARHILDSLIKCGLYFVARGS